MGMRLEIDIPEHHYNNIMAIDSMSLGRTPYKGIIMFAINAIKHGKVLEQEPTTKNDLGVDCISRAEMLKYQEYLHGKMSNEENHKLWEFIKALPSVTPQEPKIGEWIAQNDDYFDWYECSECGYGSEGEMQYSSEYDVRTNYCPCCGAKMEEVEE